VSVDAGAMLYAEYKRTGTSAVPPDIARQLPGRIGGLAGFRSSNLRKVSLQKDPLFQSGKYLFISDKKQLLLLGNLVKHELSDSR
jgi:hypothetical protein